MARRLEVKRRWDIPEGDIVHRWMLSEREEVRAAVTWYFGREVFDLRVWRLDEGAYPPTRRGIQLPRDHASQVVVAGQAAIAAPSVDPTARRVP